jgi:formylglycine-generating enzyme required for sulfatase activity
VTVKEWLEFLNDPEVKSRLHSHPDERVRDREPVYATVTVDWNSEKLRALKPKDDQVRLVPTASVCVREASGTWRENTDPRVNVKLDWPVPGISLRAALEYLRWRNGRPGERWRYRLPTELEWEKAARGVDRRTFVWGDYLTWCYCRCESGGYRPSRIEPVGACPEDESVFGVRDMAGSLREVAMGRRMERARYAPVRGGDWNSSDRQHFHIANLNGQLPEQSFGSGFRLVAAPLDESSGKE